MARDQFLDRGEPRAALAHALRALELDDEHAEAAHLVSLIYLYFCSSSAEDCRLDEAERHARVAMENRANFREARNTLGVILVHQERYDEAILVLEPLANDMLYATPETAWGNLGWAYLRAGKLDKAIEALRRSIALQPDFCVGAYRLGLAYEKKGDWKAAQQALSRALDVGRPECSGLQDAYWARARLGLRLGDAQAAKSDLVRCRELSSENKTGRECAAMLNKLQ